MKKFLSAILVVAMLSTFAFAFSACGSSSSNSEASSANKSNSGEATKSEVAATGEELHMATNAFFPPYEYYENETIVGIDAEVAQAICDKLGYTLVIDDMEFDSIITAVQTGKADFGMAGMTVTDERKEAVDFSDTYTNAIQVIIVKDGTDKIKSADDLETATIGVQRGTTGDLYVSDYEESGATIERFSKGNDAILALSTGKVDAVVIDNEPAKAFVAENEGLSILEEPFESEEYAICLKKGSELTEKINAALKELKEDGTIDKINAKYIGD